MIISIRAATLVASLFVAGGAAAQGMLLDFAADKVIKKYQSAAALSSHVVFKDMRAEMGIKMK